MQYAKRNILIVEDNLQDFIIFNEVLGQIRDFFIHLDHAESMSKALELAEQNTYDIAFLDLFLPDSFGQESFSTLQTVMSQCPIVILSGLSDKNIALDIVKLGAQDYLVKGEFDSTLLEKSIVYSIERRRFQERLAMNERKYRSTFRNIGVSIVEADVTGISNYFKEKRDNENMRFVDVLHSDGYLTNLSEELQFSDMNPEALSLFGYSSLEHFIEGFVKNKKEVIQQFTPMFKAMWNGQSYFEGETLFRDVKDNPIYALMKVKFLEENNGTQRMLISIADITVLKQKEREVIRQSAILQGISDSASTLLYYHDSGTAILKTLELFTQAMEGSMGIAIQLDSEAPKLRYAWHRKGLNIHDKVLESTFDNWMDQEARVRLQKGDCLQINSADLNLAVQGHQGMVSLLLAPLLLEGALAGVIAICKEKPHAWNDYDLSSLQSIAGNIGASIARYEAQDQLRALNENLEGMVQDRTVKMEAAIQELESFSYSISHDLRAPLRAITGFSQVLEQEIGERLSDTETGFLNHIVRGADEMSHLIDDLLDFSRMGQKEVSPVPLNMTRLANEQVDRLKPSVKDGISLEFTLGELHDCIGDPSMIRQVFQNFIGNAIKYSKPESTNRIGISSVEEGELVRYTISDEGVGFDMRYVDKIFGVFQRLHPESEFDGTGVGLAIVQRIVARHGGQVDAQGEVGKGSTFTFTLPKAPKKTVEAANAEASSVDHP